MATPNPAQASLALRRFGLGPRPGDIAAIAADPQGALLEEIKRPAEAMLEGKDLLSSQQAYARNREAEEIRRVNRAAAAAANKPVPADPGTEDAIFKSEVNARLQRLMTSPNGLQERLVMFWSNHFCIAISKGNEDRVMAGPFERETVRPHLFGKFADMLKAVEQHPAMLIYLDNNQSIGPNSRVGISNKRGLNENLAREILELHTLGVDGGYTQADVTSLSRIITGWTFVSPDDDALYGGRFTFSPIRHEPGAHTLLGKTYEQAGLAQGEAALADLAKHPSTARFIARKLAAHFVSDTPPPALVDTLAKVFLATEGDLGAVTRALIQAPEAWSVEPAKVRTPLEFVVAAARLTGKPTDPQQVVGPLPALGQPLWNPSGPNGFPDKADSWATPEGMKTRLNVAARLGEQAAAGAEPMQLLAEATGGAVSDATRQAVQRAESKAQAIALLLMSPEFQRR
ncbi:MAG: DUF1800 domain-containing protein [Bauldia sp.]